MLKPGQVYNMTLTIQKGYEISYKSRTDLISMTDYFGSYLKEKCCFFEVFAYLSIIFSNQLFKSQ